MIPDTCQGICGHTRIPASDYDTAPIVGCRDRRCPIDEPHQHLMHRACLLALGLDDEREMVFARAKHPAGRALTQATLF